MKMNQHNLLFENFQSIDCVGVAAIALESLNDKKFLAIASYHQNGWKTESLVYLMCTITNKFQILQKLETFGAHDAEMILFNNTIFLFLSEDRNEKTSKINSSLFIYNEHTESFLLKQKIKTDGAHAAELFINKNNDLYLAVANFGNRLASRYQSYSKIYKWSDSDQEMISVAEIKTQGATDFEHMAINGIDYLIVSNEGALQSGLHQISQIFELKVVNEDS
jgi:hypothetical protein